ncbi:hypothetical protein EVAR_17159_1 [Eumeta japonica]|uniref:Uncharacterized protein n=1 Tax=Eumeta variegata TaxID=151549 RepID=A0A4C1U8U2_EUMVA|nr:hypothetical protein EVAR_17159_1 [Eumeta japonica]
MSNAAERGGRLCLSVARSALSLALQALNGTPQSEQLPLRPEEKVKYPFEGRYSYISNSLGALGVRSAVGVDVVFNLSRASPEIDSTFISTAGEFTSINLRPYASARDRRVSIVREVQKALYAVPEGKRGAAAGVKKYGGSFSNEFCR